MRRFCVFPQEGITNYPGAEEVVIEGLKRSATVVGGAPYVDADPHGQIDCIFEIARDFDVDIDLHLDFSFQADKLDAAARPTNLARAGAWPSAMPRSSPPCDLTGSMRRPSGWRMPAWR
jgi:hypothetical protein